MLEDPLREIFEALFDEARATVQTQLLERASSYLEILLGASPEQDTLRVYEAGVLDALQALDWTGETLTQALERLREVQ